MSTQPSTATPSPATRRPTDPTPVSFTRIIDGEWMHWTVVEIDARMVPGSHGARCLIFAQQDCVRRVWDFPSDWRALDATALEELSWHR